MNPKYQSEQLNSIRVLFFSIARSASGMAETMIQCTEPMDEIGLWNYLLSAHPGLTSIRDQIRLTRNGEFALSDELFKPGDEVAMIPPVSGG